MQGFQLTAHLNYTLLQNGWQLSKNTALCERQIGRKTGSRHTCSAVWCLTAGSPWWHGGFAWEAGRSLPVFTVTGSGSNCYQYPISIDQPYGEHITHTYTHYSSCLKDVHILFKIHIDIFPAWEIYPSC